MLRATRGSREGVDLSSGNTALNLQTFLDATGTASSFKCQILHEARFFFWHPTSDTTCFGVRAAGLFKKNYLINHTDLLVFTISKTTFQYRGYGLTNYFRYKTLYK